LHLDDCQDPLSLFPSILQYYGRKPSQERLIFLQRVLEPQPFKNKDIFSEPRNHVGEPQKEAKRLKRKKKKEKEKEN